MSRGSDAELPLAAARDEQRARLLLAWMPAILHRMNNQTGFVLGMADLLRRTEQDPERRGQLGLVRDQAQLSADLLRGIGDFALRKREPKSLQDLSRVVSEAVDLCATIAQSKLCVRKEPARGACVVRVEPDGLRWLLIAVLHAGLPGLAARWTALEVEQLRLRCTGNSTRVSLLLCFETPESMRAEAAPRPADLQALAREVGGRLCWRATPRGQLVRLVWAPVAAL